ncbi:nucleolin 2 [Pyrus x bretschneideri]|uniref:nucleolin 2 n=1 Tax=Pyrus x bretschneideri TaxID=225117 RepID=UPI00202E76F6|nr:nucleolin 2 [Pyrus x bretschneideri]
MGSVDRVDDRTFRVNLTGNSVIKLRESVREKLKEFMGDYTDDTLVEYVIVLLRNGRGKEEAKNELNVFLGDDSDSFVSWLWDHLASNSDLHLQSQDSEIEDVSKRKTTSGDLIGKSDSYHLSSEPEREKSNNKVTRSRHNREWKGLARDEAEPPPFRSSEIGDIHVEDKSHSKVSRAKSPSRQSAAQRKRIRSDERHNTEREPVSQVQVDAPRRLLQFAMRDALTTSRQSNSATQPTLKRLRSVVSTPTVDSSLVDRPRRIQSVARVPNPMSTVMKAVAEAAEDVTRVKPSGSVFDRLGRGMEFSETSVPLASFRDAATGDVEFEDNVQLLEQTQSSYLARSQYSGQYVGNAMLESETGLASDFISDKEGFDDVNVMGRSVTDVSQTGTFGGSKGENSLTSGYNVAKNVDDVMRLSRNTDHGQPIAAANSSHKIMNISVNVNTWKPPHYQEPREVADDDWKSLQDSAAGVSKSGLHVMNENGNPVGASNGNAIPAADSQKMLSSSSGLYASGGRPLEDADSRTIFVNNVHFAATKDSLSRHFNKFGEVLKVVIVTDSATGQPKGSAYVEFTRKEAADNALSLDGTSFMSRILKVEKRGAAHQEAAPGMMWPRVARGSPFATARFGRSPFPRGMSGAYRPRPLIKPGARSLQWKRDTQATPGETGSPATASAVPSPTARSLTYVRTEPKPEGN